MVYVGVVWPGSHRTSKIHVVRPSARNVAAISFAASSVSRSARRASSLQITPLCLSTTRPWIS